jgi:hypothetical protein
MKRPETRVVGAILLIAVGVLLLLQNAGIVVGALGLLWALLFGAGGAMFLYVFLTDREQWWAVIPAFALLGLAGTIVLNELIPEGGGAWAGMVFLLGIGASFWVIYFVNREHWWAVIPGGVLITLALVTGLSSVFEGAEMGGVFFLGLALTFGLLSFLQTPEGRMKWALIPAAVMFAMGVVTTAAATEIFKYVWPAVLVLAGVYLIFRALTSKRSW